MDESGVGPGGAGTRQDGAERPPDSAGAGAVGGAAALSPHTDTAPPSRARSPAFGAGVRWLAALNPLQTPPPLLPSGAPPWPQVSPPQRLLQAVSLSGRLLQAGGCLNQNVLEISQQLGPLTLQPGPERPRCPLPARVGRG